MNNLKYPILQHLMKLEGLKIRGMAAELGVNRDTLARWLGGKNRLSLEMAWNIRDKYFPECSIDYLFCENGKDSRYSENQISPLRW